MPTTVFLSIRGDDATRALESFRRALGEDATSLVIVPTNDESGYHGSAEVGDLAAAREAFALARKPFPTLRAYLGAGGRDEPVTRPAGPPNGEGRPARSGESRSRSGERPTEGRAERGEGRGRGTEGRDRGQERGRETGPPVEGEGREGRRAPLRGRSRSGRRPPQGEAPVQ